MEASRPGGARRYTRGVSEREPDFAGSQGMPFLLAWGLIAVQEACESP